MEKTEFHFVDDFKVAFYWNHNDTKQSLLGALDVAFVGEDRRLGEGGSAVLTIGPSAYGIMDHLLEGKFEIHYGAEDNPYQSPMICSFVPISIRSIRFTGVEDGYELVVEIGCTIMWSFLN